MIFSTLKHMILLRMHDPAAMRFSTPDPLMEQYPSLSPYTYCAANPNKYFDLYGLKTYRIDDSGNLISTEENDEEDVIIVLKDNEQTAIYRMGGIFIDGNYRNSYDYINSKDNTRRRGFFDYYRIRGDENAIELFFFLAAHTNVEWSLALTGEASNGLCFLSTSFANNEENGMTKLLNTQLFGGYYIRSLYHNHTIINGSAYPSRHDYDFVSSVMDAYHNNNPNYTNIIEFWFCKAITKKTERILFKYFP